MGIVGLLTDAVRELNTEKRFPQVFIKHRHCFCLARWFRSIRNTYAHSGMQNIKHWRCIWHLSEIYARLSSPRPPPPHAWKRAEHLSEEKKHSLQFQTLWHISLILTLQQTTKHSSTTLSTHSGPGSAVLTSKAKADTLCLSWQAVASSTNKIKVSAGNASDLKHFHAENSWRLH